MYVCVSSTGQLAVGTCEIVMLNRDSSQPKRTIARQTARCACRRGQIAGTTRARPACVDGEMQPTHTFSHCVHTHTYPLTACNKPRHVIRLHCWICIALFFFFCLVSKSCITQYNTIVRLATCKEMFLSAVCAVTAEDRWKGKEKNVIFGFWLSLWFRRNIWACLFCRAPDMAEDLMGLEAFCFS